MQITELEVVVRDGQVHKKRTSECAACRQGDGASSGAPAIGDGGAGPWSLLATREGAGLGAAILLAAVLAFMGLGNHAFWDDEANTALFARNLLDHGALTAWDGTNVAGFRQGAELDERLVNVYMPPLQYYAAALGLTLVGSTTVGGRVVFVLMGLAAVVALGLWARWHLGRAVPAWLPAMLVALSPAYLMYIRQCRYYAPAVLLTLVLLATAAYPASTRRARITAAVVGSAAAFLLMMTNYLNAAALAACLPLLALLPRYRTRAFATWLTAVGVALVVAGVMVLLVANPFARDVAGADPVRGFSRFATLSWWHLTGLGSFEFFPLAVPFALAALLAARGLRAGASLAREGLMLALLMLVYTLVIVAFSPQPVGLTRVADMRYVVPLIPLGAAATACLLTALWQAARAQTGGAGQTLRVATVALGLTLATTNALSLGILGGRPLRATLIDYVRENRNDYTTGTESLIKFLRSQPHGRVVQIVPDFMAYSPMFYVPQQHYCCQLTPEHPLTPMLRGQLPDYVFDGRVPPDLVLLGESNPQQALTSLESRHGVGSYRLAQVLPGDARDRSRPEIPWHSFGPPAPAARGFVVFERVR